MPQDSPAESPTTHPSAVSPSAPPSPGVPYFDPLLVASGDPRPVLDHYKFWKTEEIAKDLHTRRHGFHIAIENWKYDINIGAVIRNANAFAAGSVRLVGKRRWDRRAAMGTHIYLHCEHHPCVSDLKNWADANNLSLVGVENNIANTRRLEEVKLPVECVFVFGHETDGLSPEAQECCDWFVEITQYGSVRSLNAAVSSGIIMHQWAIQHANPDQATSRTRSSS